MSLAHMDWAFQQEGLTGSEKFVLVALADRVGKDTGICWPSIERVAADTSLGTATVKRAIAKLVEAGLIERRRKRGEEGRYAGNVYVFPHDPHQGSQRSPVPGLRVIPLEPEARTPEPDHPSGGTAEDHDEPRTLVGALVAKYAESTQPPPTDRSRARVGAQLKRLEVEGYGEYLEPALDRMIEKRLDPSLLPQLVSEQLPRAGQAEGKAVLDQMMRRVGL